MAYMDLNELLGIDPNDPTEQNAAALVAADAKLLDDLIAIRERRGVTQTQLGQIMGISQGAVARIESGERDPRLSTLRRYALALGVLIRHEVDEHPRAPEPPSASATGHATVVWTDDVLWTSKVDVVVGAIAIAHHRP